ncbi:MAG: hypothetical protein LBL90_05970 [Prevotellaceae bacterium]|nr:hypothetical protein [Prevotellaceae bacterium]
MEKASTKQKEGPASRQERTNDGNRPHMLSPVKQPKATPECIRRMFKAADDWFSKTAPSLSQAVE